ncbi:MAG: DUF4296 domain-containing protein [Flavobacteriales bacterium]|nr:DUF4296 domain-containing protein [Flavobacteriales bacterium]MCB9449111.1 DUF4296 domain-containing protein [Flavobacteriales bacterium]
MKHSIRAMAVTALLLGACHEEEEKVLIPAAVIPQDTMTSMMVDIQLVEGAANLNKLPGDQRLHYQAYDFVYEKFHVSRERFDSSFSFYRHHPELMLEIYEEVVDELGRLEVTEAAK